MILGNKPMNAIVQWTMLFYSTCPFLFCSSSDRKAGAGQNHEIEKKRKGMIEKSDKKKNKWHKTTKQSSVIF